ncbi:MAG: tetratricopeptide repeat protein [Nitrospirae bacterium]|nr:tetratricopeptide repeat protein [Nitrospirota bacterium]
MQNLHKEFPARSYMQQGVPFVVVMSLVTIIAILVNSGTFSSPFVFDDIPHIVFEGGRIRDLSNFLDLSGTRYVGELSIALNYYFGGLNVFGYHLVNVSIHIINGLLVWCLVTLIFRTPAMMAGASGREQLNGFIALAASLIFITHPVQTQAVTYIIQRFASLATLFYFLSLVLFLKWRLASGKRFRIIIYLLSISSAILAMKTKEISFTLPFMILLFEFTFFKDRRRHLYVFVPYLLTLAVIPLTLMDFHIPVSNIAGSLEGAAQNTLNISRGDYLLTQFRVIVTYIRLLVLPVNQNLDYDYPVYHSLSTPAVFLSFLFLLAILCLAVYLFVYSRRNGNVYLLLTSFGILWFFITLSVESSIIPIKDVIFEHRLYLPGAGFAMSSGSALLYGIEYWRERSGIRVSQMLAASIVIAVVVIPLSLLTFKRNLVWGNEVALWTDVVRKSPKKARGYDNLGAAYYKEGRIDEAINEYKTALMFKPDLVEAIYDLAVAYRKKGLYNEAIEQFKTFLRLRPESAPVHHLLGSVYSGQGRADEAIEEYRNALRLNPKLTEAHYDLGVAYYKKGLSNEAIEEFKTVLNLDADFAKAHNSLGFIFANMGKIDEAIGEFRAALRLNPDFSEARNNLVLAFKAKEIKERQR